MPSKKKKYNARFPSGRIKKIMQSDEEIGKVAQAVPVIISRTLELFVESLLAKTLKITNSRNAKTLSPSHMKQCIMSEQRFDFLRELVKNVPDINVAEEAANYHEQDGQSSPEEQDSDTPFDLSLPSTSSKAYGTSANGIILTRCLPIDVNGATKPVTSTVTSSTIFGNESIDSENIKIMKHNNVIKYTSTSKSKKDNSQQAKSTSLSLSNKEQAPSVKSARRDSTPIICKAPEIQQQIPRSKLHTIVANSTSGESLSSLSSFVTIKPLGKCPKRLKYDTATPASFTDYELNKPIVKIDYSNLQSPITIHNNNNESASATPLSAPANLNVTNTFQFGIEPVINIDLTNIVTSKTCAESSIASVPTHGGTISIGTVPEHIKTTNLTLRTPLNSFDNPVCSKSLKDTKLYGPTYNKNVSILTPPSANTKIKDSFFELDEDYDNI